MALMALHFVDCRKMSVDIESVVIVFCRQLNPQLK